MLPRVHVVNSSQGSFLTFGNDVISNHLFTQDNWENWLFAITGEFTRGFDKPIVFDLGANLGAYTIPTALMLNEKMAIFILSNHKRLCIISSAEIFSSIVSIM
ncbi:hypothetical protein [Enterobacter roggenkampii]|uniref:hypothetical protein n=1 Tax=Enterobacter roggenkampii TaxID=1812935 RepID=UPI000798FDC9|nr:hypothetical protein [Enterobacter roggenkampii]SAA20071.1 Uncharacterised protein [Enterobacter roggenkampii]